MHESKNLKELLMKDQPCPCCSGPSYQNCCQSLHRGAKAESAEKLMRSRYSAYALNLPDYIIETTHPASPQYFAQKETWKRKISEFSKSNSFEQLEILSTQEKQPMASVCFSVKLLQEQEDCSFSEKSLFEFYKGRYYYLNGHTVKGFGAQALKDLPDDKPFQTLPLAYLGDAVLRKKAAEITQITPEIKLLVQQMEQTMHAHRGIGLAAPQVHQSLRLFMTYLPENENPNKNPEQKPQLKVFINPIISKPSVKTWLAQEGCLSIPAIYANVERPQSILCQYTDLAGQTHCQEFSGWAARAILHENDHLNGGFFFDRVSKKERQSIELFLKGLKTRLMC